MDILPRTNPHKLQKEKKQNEFSQVGKPNQLGNRAGFSPESHARRAESAFTALFAPFLQSGQKIVYREHAVIRIFRIFSSFLLL